MRESGATPRPAPGIGPVRVLLVDDHRVFTEVLRRCVEAEPDLRCVGVAHSRHEALARAAAEEIDVAVVDLDLPDAHDLELVRALRAACPRARVLVLTAYARPELARRALQAGVVGFLGKESALPAVLRAVRHASAAAPVVEPALPTRREPDPALTPRELDVLRRLGLGHEAHVIADELGISLHTTRGHIKALMRKLGARSQLNAVVTAERLGYLSLGRRC